jgi:hypothetical protein
MIPDDQLHLLTAAVDGELTPEEDRRLRRVLVRSAAARVLFAQLQADRDRLRKLPQATPPADLRDRVMAKIADVPPPVPTEPVVRPAAAPFQRTRRSWVPVAVAASLLLVITTASFGFFVRLADRPARIGGHGPTAHGSVAPALPPDDRQPSAPAEVEPGANAVARTNVPSVSPSPGPGLTPPRPDFVGPPLPGNNPNPLAAPPRPAIPPYQMVEVRVPFLAPMIDLEREDVRQQFADELGRDPAFRIDVFAPDTVRAAEAFQHAGKGSGLVLFTDAMAQDRIRRKFPGPFVIYTEALTPAELRDLFGKLAHDDAKHGAFDSVHATPLQAADQQELRGVLGYDPAIGKRTNPAPAVPNPADPPIKPISTGTGDQVVKALNKPPEKSAVLLSLSPRANPMSSKELAEFRARRGERRPNVVPVMIVIRTPGG